MRFGRWRALSRDEGSTQIILLAAMVCAFALTLMAVQVAQANDMRSRAQIAADSTAIAAVTPLRDEAVSWAQRGQNPVGMGLWEVATLTEPDPAYNRAARDYAQRNQAELIRKVEPSGLLGYTMKADVQTIDCVIKDEKELTAQEREDLKDPRKLCTDNRGRRGIPKGRGTATAIAQLKMPPCDYTYRPVVENGATYMKPTKLLCGPGLDRVVTWDEFGAAAAPRERILRVFKIRLVAKEDVKYTGVPDYGSNPEWTGDPPNLGDINACKLVKEILTNAYKKIGYPYVWGGESYAEGGFDCSGMIYASYLEAGVPIPRTTFDQWPYGVRVPDGQEKPGDLVFFNAGPGTGSNSPGHVGLVLDPSRKLMIEARCTACGPIRVSSYDRPNKVGFTRPLARSGKDCNENEK
ncbi:NlpC/P60 family protein [Actinomadura macrotermitis]|uniref:NlpC/P60 domain-containing protein n=1 Tax=Actinomadura macrotermitis TaxID=2585200 RepID=A0A7K0BS46_9ACTN|nr:hypothetical protein [Actinomadura macrotermitis]